MTTHDRDKVIAAAIGCIEGPYDRSRAITITGNEIERLYAIAFEAGRVTEREDAERYRFLREYMASERTDLDDEFVSACSTNEPERLDEFIDLAIRARGDKNE